MSSSSNTESSHRTLPPSCPYSLADLVASTSRVSTYRNAKRANAAPYSGLDVGTDTERDLQRRRASIIIMDRKRRLTATNDDGSLQGRSSVTNGQQGASNTRVEHDRPLPSLPHPGTEAFPKVPGSSRENAIDLVSSSSTSESGSLPPFQVNHSLPAPPQPQETPMEYSLPRWQPDSEVTNCPICGTQFSFWYRKHHCRKCGRVVCSSCSPHRITIPRQYIVRPPEPAGQISIEEPERQQYSSPQSIDLTADETREVPVSNQHSGHPILNPALGGGEEVRLCNPCVPDPNPEPPLTYGGIRSTFDRFSDPNWETSLPALPRSHPLHRAHRSLSGPQISGPRTNSERDAYRYRRRSHLAANLAGHQPPLEESASRQFYPSRYAFPIDSNLPSHSPPSPSSARGMSYFFPTHQSGPASSSFQHSFASSSRERSSHVRPIFYAERQPFAQPSPRAPVDERDICPICSMQLPLRGIDGSEDAREAHVRDCIESSSRTGRSSPGSSPPSQSPHLLRMLTFTATEKDCLNEDSTPQECTICMEEYEVGDKLARLECLCKFHKLCIVEWFGRKKECPVHKFS